MVPHVDFYVFSHDAGDVGLESLHPHSPSHDAQVLLFAPLLDGGLSQMTHERIRLGGGLHVDLEQLVHRGVGQLDLWILVAADMLADPLQFFLTSRLHPTLHEMSPMIVVGKMVMMWASER